MLSLGMLVLLWLAPAARAEWSFAVLGDTRGAHSTTNGVSLHLSTIAAKIVGMHPDLVLVSGDLCNGDDTNGLTALSYAQQFTNWNMAMDTVTASHIAIYPVRGNHENSCNETAPIPALKQAYYDAYGACMPTNGPNNGPADDQQGFTYSFVHSNATFIVLDQYFYYDMTSETGYHSLAEVWLNQQLAQVDTPYTIVMAHVPVFMATGQETPEHFFGANPAGYEQRSNFWNSLGACGARLYVCGHIHNLSVSLAPDGAGNGIYQLTSGNGGAPLDIVLTNHDACIDVQYTNDTNFGFALVTVSNDAMTIDYYLLDTKDDTWQKAAYVTTIPAVPEPAAVAAAMLAPLWLFSRRNGRTLRT